MAVAESQFKLLAQFPLKSKQRNWNPMSFASKITNNQIHEEGTFSFCRIFNGKSRALYLKLKDSTNNKTTSIGRSNWSEVRIMWKDPFWVKVFLLKLFAFRVYKSKSCRTTRCFWSLSYLPHTSSFTPLTASASSKILNIRYSVLESRLTLASSLRALTLLSVVAMWWITAMLSTASKLSSCNRALLSIDNDSWHLKWWLRQKPFVHVFAFFCYITNQLHIWQRAL